MGSSNDLDDIPIKLRLTLEGWFQLMRTRKLRTLPTLPLVEHIPEDKIESNLGNSDTGPSELDHTQLQAASPILREILQTFGPGNRPEPDPLKKLRRPHTLEQVVI